MKMNSEIQTVISVYSAVKQSMWSKTAKRILGIHILGNKSLTTGWEKTFKKWWGEINNIENNHGPIPMLDENDETMEMYFLSVINWLCSKGFLSTEDNIKITESVNTNRSSIIKPENPYAQAIIVKLFCEASIDKIPSFKEGRGGYSIPVKEFLELPLESLIQRSKTFDVHNFKY